MSYRLIEEFERLFQGRRYLHRVAGQGDLVARQLYEDLFEQNTSTRLTERIASGQRVVNIGNKRVGIMARRGDGTFGELIPSEPAVVVPGFRVASGLIATVEIGAEVKVLAKAMIKQIDRVVGDLVKQVGHFRHGGDDPICVAIVGINQAPYCVSYEADRVYKTDGKGMRHPTQEAEAAEARLVALARPAFFEFIVLRYAATNEEPYAFSWQDVERTRREYAASLVRISREYDRRFS
jgi:hypothetical protein